MLCCVVSVCVRTCVHVYVSACLCEGIFSRQYNGNQVSSTYKFSKKFYDKIS